MIVRIVRFHHIHAVSIEKCAIGLGGRVVQATVQRFDSEFHIVCFRIVKLQCFYLLAKICDCASPATQIGLKRLYTGEEEVGALAKVDSHVNGFDQVQRARKLDSSRVRQCLLDEAIVFGK